MEQFDLIYNLIYSALCIIILIAASSTDFKGTQFSYSTGKRTILIFLTIYLLLFGLRDIEVGTDTKSYVLMWDIHKGFTLDKEFFTSALISILKYFGFGYGVFLFSYTLFLVIPLYFSIIYISKRFDVNPLFILFVFTSLFFFKSIGINIIRQGVSLALILVFICQFNFNKWYALSLKTIIIGALAFVIHNTAVISLLAIFVVSVLKNLNFRYYILIYFLSIVLSRLEFGIHQILPNIKDFDERRVESYVENLGDIFVVGFKPQFVVFNTVFLFIFLFIRKKIGKIPQYEFIFKYYLLISVLFFFSFQMSYSDRWGIMSWIVIPFLIAPIYSKLINIRTIKTSMSFFFIIVYIFFSFYS